MPVIEERIAKFYKSLILSGIVLMEGFEFVIELTKLGPIQASVDKKINTETCRLLTIFDSFG